MSLLSQLKPLDFPKLGLVRLPKVHIEDAHKVTFGVPLAATNTTFLAAIVQAGFEVKNKEGKIPDARYKSQVDRELAIFEELGFTDYVLLVWLVIEKARSHGTFIDYGRGSCVGSTVFWLLGLTGIDPIKEGLLFERFVSRVRSKKQIIDGEVYLQGDLIADADLNLGNNRDEIIEWLKTIYPNRICKIVTYGLWTGKALIKDVCKLYGNMNEDQAQKVSDLVESKYGVVEDLQEAYDKGARFKEWADQNPKMFQIALGLRNLIKQTGVHASGYAISYHDFDGYLPIQLDKEKQLISSYPMDTVSGLAVKLDLLGLVTNRIIKNVLEMTGQDLDSINLRDDPLIYDQFQRGAFAPWGLYQISGDCAYGVTNAIKPKNIDELCDVNAIARPGALAYQQDYIAGNKECPHPIFAEILKPTRNLCLFQEQMMQMAVAIGFTLDEAEVLRKIVGKKKPEEAKEWKGKIHNKVKEKGLPSNVGDILWKILEDSANYSFNKSHSFATASLSALTTYLKYKHPLEFYCACLNATKDMKQKAAQAKSDLFSEMHQFGLKVLAPNLVKSGIDFAIENGDIRFGLSHIRGISDITMQKLLTFVRTDDKFVTFEAAKAAGINIAVLTGLIYCGCMETKGLSRARLALEAQSYNELHAREKILVKKLAKDYGDDLLKTILALTTLKNDKGKPHIAASRFATFQRDYAPFKQIFLQNNRNEELCAYILERHFLGFSYSNTLKAIFAGQGVTNLMDINEVSNELPDTHVRFACLVRECEKKTSRNSNKAYLKLELYDDSGAIDAFVFGQQDIDMIIKVYKRLPETDDIIVVNGRKKDSSVYVTNVSIQQNPVVLKKSELPALAPAKTQEDNDE